MLYPYGLYRLADIYMTRIPYTYYDIQILFSPDNPQPCGHLSGHRAASDVHFRIRGQRGSGTREVHLQEEGCLLRRIADGPHRMHLGSLWVADGRQLHDEADLRGGDIDR